MKNTEEYELFQIFPDAGKYKTKLTSKVRNHKPWKRPDPQEIFSIIPGTVSAIKIGVSDHIEKGEELMEYEAMKMQNIIKAPFAGTVEKIFVKEGEKLAKGVLMIYLKSDKEFVAGEYTTSSVLDLNG